MAEDRGDGELVDRVELLQIKSKWQGEKFGYVPNGFRTSKRLEREFDRRWAAGESCWFCTLTYDPWPFVEGGKPPGWQFWSQADREAFYQTERFQAGCKACHEASKRGRHVGEFLRRLRRELGQIAVFYTREVQENGMPHFHLLVFTKGQGDVDQVAMERLLLVLWRHGEQVDAGAATDKARSYVAKYLTKGISPPAWMLAIAASARLYSSTRHFWQDLASQAERPEAARPLAARRARTATVADILREPGKHLQTIARFTMKCGAVVHRRVNMDVPTYVQRICAAVSCMGGFTPGTYGRADLQPQAAISLDLLLYCGAVAGGGVVDSS